MKPNPIADIGHASDIESARESALYPVYLYHYD